MKLGSILNIHSQHQPQHSVSAILGDGYLLSQNRLYRKIRNLITENEYQLTDKPSLNYQTFPMGELENLIEQKKLPYTDNVSALTDVCRRTQDQISWDHVVDNLKANYVFHESCHAVARSLRPPIQSKNRDWIVALLIEESFANTCEMFLLIDANEAVHRIFIEKNSYFTVFEIKSLLKKMADKYSPAAIFKMILVSYLWSHFLWDRITDSDFKKLLSYCRIQTDSDFKMLRSLCMNAFDLNPRFRQTTTEMYLKLNQINDPVAKVLNFDPFEILQSNTELQKWVEQLSQKTGESYA